MSGTCSGFPCTTTIQYSQHTLLSTWHLSISFLHPLSQPLIPPGHSGPRCMQVCLKRMTVTMRNGSHDKVCWPVTFRTNLKTPPSLSGEIYPNSPRKSSPDLHPSLPPKKKHKQQADLCLKSRDHHGTSWFCHSTSEGCGALLTLIAWPEPTNLGACACVGGGRGHPFTT